MATDAIWASASRPKAWALTASLRRSSSESLRRLPRSPAHARRELRRDYNRIVYAKNGIDARKAYDELVAKWTPLAPAVVRSLEEAGNQLLTFYEFPRAMWKSIRTTNALENLNREFRRRTKTQASFSSEESAVALLFGLIASGQIQLRRIDGYQRLSKVPEHAEAACAFYLFIRQPMGRKSALRREILWILRGFQGRLSC